MAPRYQKIKGQVGIRKDLTNGKYQAYKRVEGKRYSKYFSSIQSAQKWRQGFHPLFNANSEEKPTSSFTTSCEPNGTDKGYTFLSAWRKYEEVKLSTLELSTQELMIDLYNFCAPLWNIKMVDFNPELLDMFLREEKQKAIVMNGIKKNNIRYSFDKELDRLKTFLNWYQENYVFNFVSPILERHYDLGLIMKKKVKEKKLPLELMVPFFEGLPRPPHDPEFWRDFAVTQFLAASRVSEIAGIQDKTIDLINGVLPIQHVVVWGRKSKKFLYLKEYPKNTELRFCHLTEILRGVISRRLLRRPLGSTYLFTLDGSPLNYRQIEGAYNRSLLKCGLYPRFSGTHIMRHSMANVTRKIMGTSDAVQSVTGHKDRRMVEIYSDMPQDLQRQSVEAVEKKLIEEMNNQREGCAKVLNLF